MVFPKILQVLCFYSVILIVSSARIVEFPKAQLNISSSDYAVLSSFNDSQFLSAVELAVDGVNRSLRWEQNIIDADITITDGSVSHAQLLETLPSEEAKEYHRVATQIERASTFVLNECRTRGIDDRICAQYMSQLSLPVCNLLDKCEELNNRVTGLSAFRRLLPANYKNGVYEMYSDTVLPEPRLITSLDVGTDKYVGKNNKITLEDRNRIFVQWAQFIEHDLSKSVVSTMHFEGTPIECCSKESTILLPRHRHSACAPLYADVPYGRRSCLNYVRSALAINQECKFGPALQLNQATDKLDLSQLYGHSEAAKNRMRSFTNGLLKATYIEVDNLLPYTDTILKKRFCVTNNENNCFMAGDSRVNSNPFMITIYTIFLRSHNAIANKLLANHRDWDDERLYNEARKINIHIYQWIIYNEWIPAVLGEEYAAVINDANTGHSSFEEKGVSNEFAVAAIRFYYSMMPDILWRNERLHHTDYTENVIDRDLSSVATDKLFSLKDHFYSSHSLSSSEKLDVIINAMLNQKSMDMDLDYVADITKNYFQNKDSINHTYGANAFAWDVQRGRDHGVAPYIKYLEICQNTKILDWNDLSPFISPEILSRLQNIYRTVDSIDLIVGGVSEQVENDLAVGPTFACILAEQFYNIRRSSEQNYDWDEGSISHSGSKLLCETTNLHFVPNKIFHITSDENPLIACSESQSR